MASWRELEIFVTNTKPSYNKKQRLKNANLLYYLSEYPIGCRKAVLLCVKINQNYRWLQLKNTVKKFKPLIAHFVLLDVWYSDFKIVEMKVQAVPKNIAVILQKWAHPHPLPRQRVKWSGVSLFANPRK